MNDSTCFGSFSASHSSIASSTISIPATSATLHSWLETLEPEPYGALATSTAGCQILSFVYSVGHQCIWVINFFIRSMKSVPPWMVYHPACNIKCKIWYIHHIPNQPLAWRPAATILEAPSVVISGGIWSLSMPCMSAHTHNHISEMNSRFCRRSHNRRGPKE